MKFKYRIKKIIIYSGSLSDTDGRDCFYQFINEKMYWLIHLTRNLKMKTGTDSKIFFSNVLLMQQKSASCLSEKHFLYIHRIY